MLKYVRNYTSCKSLVKGLRCSYLISSLPSKNSKVKLFLVIIMDWWQNQENAVIAEATGEVTSFGGYTLIKCTSL